MEEFLKINWHPPLDDLIDNVFVNEQRMKEESVMFRILRGFFNNPFNEFESDDEEDGDQDEDNNDEKIKTDQKKGDLTKKKKEATIQKSRDYIPGVVKLPFKFPRISSLTKEQHATCLKVFLKFSKRQKPELDQKSRSELELYLKLSPKIKEEQDEFLELAKSHWNGSGLKLMDKEYMNKRWRSKVEKLRKLPRYYLAAGNVPFNGNGEISVTPEATLLEMGQLPRVMIPCLNKKRQTMYCNMMKLESLYPSRDDFAGEKLTASQDPNCERLAETGEADLVISSGGLNCLAGNFGPNYNSSWILPIVVKESLRGNVVYVDKPLPPTVMTVPEKNVWMYKYVLKSQLLNPNHFTSIRLSENEEQPASQDDLFGDLYSDDLLKLEEENDRFQPHDDKKHSEEPKDLITESEKQSTTQSVTDNKVLTAVTNDDELKSVEKDSQISLEPSSNLMEVDEENLREEPDLETKQNPREFVEFEATAASSLDVKTVPRDEEDLSNEKIIEDQTQITESHDDKDSIGASYVPPVYSSGRNNVAYRIFSLGPAENDNDNSTKTKVESYRILVRIKIDGIEKLDKETLHPVMLVPKLEHQVALGAEAVTAEEALRQWTTLTYRPNTSLVRIRISADTSEIIQIERRTVMSINNEIKRLHNLNVSDSLIILHNVVNHLKALKPGNYLLRHTPTNGAFATIYQEADISAKNVFDLQSIYSENFIQTIGNVPWPPLDRGVITPSQISFERMPAMYHPAKNYTDHSFNNIRGRGRGGRGRALGNFVSRGDLRNTGKRALAGASRGNKRGSNKRARKRNKAAKKQIEQS